MFASSRAHPTTPPIAKSSGVLHNLGGEVNFVSRPREDFVQRYESAWWLLFYCGARPSESNLALTPHPKFFGPPTSRETHHNLRLPATNGQHLLLWTFAKAGRAVERVLLL